MRRIDVHAHGDLAQRRGVNYRSPAANGLGNTGHGTAVEQTEGLGIALDRHGGNHALSRLFEDFDAHLLVQLTQLNLPYLCGHAALLT